MKYQFTVLSLMIVLFQWSNVLADEPGTVFDGYLQALQEGQWQEAKEFWKADIIERSEKLGLKFKDIEAKYDCASPVIQYLDGISAGLVRAEVINVRKEEGWALLEVQLSSVSDKLVTDYYVEKTDTGWKLTSPIYLFTRDWHQRPSRFANIYYNDETKLNQYAIDAADNFIDNMCQAMAMGDDKITALTDMKIDYFLCDENDIEELTGFATQGMGILPFDAIVTQHLPHEHELTHLLVNYALDNTPLYTLPFMQEGLACYFGGRWGRSKEVIEYTGYISLAHDLCKLDDIFTVDDFYNTIGSTDISYPVSGLFVSYLIEKLGWTGFLYLYETLSGSDQMISAWNAHHIKEKILGACRTTWEEIEKEFDNYLRQFEFAGIQPVKISPMGNPGFEFTGHGTDVSVWNMDGVYAFEIRFSPDKSHGSLMFKTNNENPLKGYMSDLFARHHPNIKYNGELLGLNFSQAEIGLYNYYTNELMAKFIPSLSMSPSTWNEPNGALRFELDGKFLPESGLEELEVRVVSR